LVSSFAHNTIVNTSSPPPFVKVLRILQEIGLSSLVERELSFVVADKVREFIHIETRGDWKRRYVTILSEWVDHGLSELLRFILARKEGSCVGEDALKTIALRALTELRYYISVRNIDHRIHELFDIIKEFPESAAAIEDLKMCIETPGQRDHLVTVFRRS
jgi:anaphase-promoting complex subunit 2